jgi:hypothetical protein
VWVGLAVVIACAVAFAVVVGRAGRKTGVLEVARPVGAGQVLRRGDVREAEVGVDAVGGLVPAGEAGSVVGRVAVVPLVAGSLLAPGEVGASSGFPPAGSSLVSFAVEAGGVPEGLTAGERVAVFPGADDDGASGSDDEPDPVVGVVTGVGAGDGEDGGRVVTVLVETGAVRRAAGVVKPRVVVLSPVDREVP